MDTDGTRSQEKWMNKTAQTTDPVSALCLEQFFQPLQWQFTLSLVLHSGEQFETMDGFLGKEPRSVHHGLLK